MWWRLGYGHVLSCLGAASSWYINSSRFFVYFVHCKYSSFFSTKTKSFYILTSELKHVQVLVICFHVSLKANVHRGMMEMTRHKLCRPSCPQKTVAVANPACWGVKRLSGSTTGPHSTHTRVFTRQSGFLPVCPAGQETDSNRGPFLRIHGDMGWSSGQFSRSAQWT